MIAFLYPAFDPVALSLGPLKIRWYGLSYAIGILLSWQYCLYLVRRYPLNIHEKLVTDYLPWLVVGIILGGRLGIALFYNFDYYRHHLNEIFYFWRPGMAFHGGLIGVIFATLIYCYRHKISVLEFGDLMAPSAPIGLFFGRCANFINGELWGRPTTSPLGVIFPHVDQLPRHASQLYEAALEGIFLFIILHLMATQTKLRQKYPGILSGLFLIGYGFARTFVEFFRQPDAQIGYLWAGTTLGQWLSLPLILAGFIFIFFAYNKQKILLRDRM